MSSQFSVDNKMDPSPNQELYEKLMEVSLIYQFLGEALLQNDYSRFASYVICIPDVVDAESLALYDVSKKYIAEILKLQAGKEIVAKPKNFDLYVELISIEGVGDVTAKRWIHDGDTTIAKVNKRKDLTRTQLLGLKYLDDLKEKVPRDEVEQIFKEINSNVHKRGVKGLIAGSYRRGLKECGDIDILYHGPEDEEFLGELIDEITGGGGDSDSDEEKGKKGKGPAKNKLHVDIITCGKRKASIIVRLKRTARRVDIMYVDDDEFGAALMYFTGSKIFNIMMRGVAKSRNMKLSDKGLFDPKGKLVKTSDEKDIFKKLGVGYLDPEDRQ